MNFDFATAEAAERARQTLENRGIQTRITITDTGPVMLIRARDWRLARRQLRELEFD